MTDCARRRFRIMLLVLLLALAGVAFAEQQIPVVPTEPHDLSLPRIISA